MIEIIRRGTRQTATCKICGCVFTYEEEDIKHLENHSGVYSFVDGTRRGYKNYVACPQCNADFVVSQTRGISTESEDK